MHGFSCHKNTPVIVDHPFHGTEHVKVGGHHNLMPSPEIPACFESSALGGPGLIAETKTQKLRGGQGVGERNKENFIVTHHHY